MSFFLIQLSPLGIQIRTFRSILFEKRIKNLFGDPKVLSIGLVKLFQEFLCKLCIFVLELRVDFKVRFKKPLVALL